MRYELSKRLKSASRILLNAILGILMAQSISLTATGIEFAIRYNTSPSLLYIGHANIKLRTSSD